MASKQASKAQNIISLLNDNGHVDKAVLIGVPFTITEASSLATKYGRMWYVTVETSPDDKDAPVEILTFVDSSRGIAEQLDKVADGQDKLSNLYCPYGLRVSVYDRVADDGKHYKARTYYIATRPVAS